jgi:outer membrane protein assembly factor BamB
VSACGGGQVAEPAPTQPAARAPSRPALPPEHAFQRTFIRVVDGDLGIPVAGARVVLGGRSASSGSGGQAALPRLASERVGARVAAPGYLRFHGRVRVSGARAVTIRIYRRNLQWPVYGVNPARTQFQSAIKLRPPFRRVWEKGVGGLVEFPAVVWKGVAYVNNMHGYVRALSMDDGHEVWKRRVGSRMASSPGVDTERDQLVVTTMWPGTATVLDMRRGRILWRYRTGISEASPVVRNGVAFLGGENGHLYALDIRRHRARWVASTGEKITSSPALVGNRVFIGDYSGHAYAFDARTGRRLWSRSVGTRVYGSPAVANGRVFVPSVFSGLWALDARSGRVRWHLRLGEAHGAPGIYRGRVYFGTKSGTVYCVSASSGRVIWTRAVHSNVASASVVVDGVVYVAGTSSRILALDWRTGHTIWAFPHSEYTPVSGNGGRLLMHGYARIWAVEPKRKR